jgi:PAS domain S-box-containing protein
MAAGDRETRELRAEVAALRQRLAELEAAESQSGQDQVAAQRLKRAEGALAQSEATADAILESVSEGIVIVDRHGRIARVNAAAERMFGYERRELIGQRLELLLPESFHALHAQQRTAYFAAPRVRPMGQGLDFVGRRRDGSGFPAEISLSFVQSEVGPLAISFVTDISERKRTEAELRRQQEALYRSEKLAALGMLAAGLAHEINNPIGIISSRIELMLAQTDSEGLSAEMREDLEMLQRNVRRVARIASGLLSFARQSPRERSPVDLNRVVQETLFLAEAQLNRGGLAISTTLEPILPPLLGDAVALQQVALNLLQNAREALGGEGSVRIETRRLPDRPDRVALIVADDGPGMPPDVLARIFDPFFTTKAKGTGLGLALCYGIIQDHRGTIDVESEPGKGTRFTLTFPTLSGPPEPPPSHA